jgi:hypothetical protein
MTTEIYIVKIILDYKGSELRFNVESACYVPFLEIYQDLVRAGSQDIHASYKIELACMSVMISTLQYCVGSLGRRFFFDRVLKRLWI